jgi:hypothetical protein
VQVIGSVVLLVHGFAALAAAAYVALMVVAVSLGILAMFVEGERERLLGRQGRRRALGNEDIYLEMNQLGREVGGSVGRPWCTSAFDDDVLALHVTELAQPLAEWAHDFRPKRTP